MAYNRTNFLKRVVQFQNAVIKLQNENGDLTHKEIYWKHIYPKYGISKRTYDRWLGINAKMELKKQYKK